MKKRIFLIMTFLLVLGMSGCGGGVIYRYSQKPDDNLSRAVYEAVGKKNCIIRGKANQQIKRTIYMTYMKKRKE